MELHKTRPNRKAIFTGAALLVFMFIPMQAATKESNSESLQKAYREFSLYLSKEIVRFEIEKDWPDAASIKEQEEVMEKLDEAIKPKLSTWKNQPPITQNINDLKDNLKKLSETGDLAKQRGEDGEYFEAVARAQICRLLVMKGVADEYLKANKFSYDEIPISSDTCINKSGVYSVASSKKRETKIRTATNKSDTGIKARCKSEWKDDYRMVEFCINQQTESLNNLSRMRGSIQDKCREEWGTDYRMVEFCTKTQSDAKSRLEKM